MCESWSCTLYNHSVLLRQPIRVWSPWSTAKHGDGLNHVLLLCTNSITYNLFGRKRHICLTKTKAHIKRDGRSCATKCFAYCGERHTWGKLYIIFRGRVAPAGCRGYTAWLLGFFVRVWGLVFISTDVFNEPETQTFTKIMWGIKSSFSQIVCSLQQS
jgi:hypothetical protein